jgi:hypothetical protein
VKHSLLEFET